MYARALWVCGLRQPGVLHTGECSLASKKQAKCVRVCTGVFGILQSETLSRVRGIKGSLGHAST